MCRTAHQLGSSADRATQLGAAVLHMQAQSETKRCGYRIWGPLSAWARNRSSFIPALILKGPMRVVGPRWSAGKGEENWEDPLVQAPPLALL